MRFVEPEGKARRVLADADEMELGEIRQDNPSDGPLHPGLLRADAIVADVAKDLFAVRGEKVFRLVQQAFGFEENERWSPSFSSR